MAPIIPPDNADDKSNGSGSSPEGATAGALIFQPSTFNHPDE
jgi:hypothetical protein